jgi:HAD superfamily hydrolase (TIGR01549 family)
MTKLLIIDSNNILEDHASFLQRKDDMISHMSDVLIDLDVIKKDTDLSCYMARFQELHTNYPWEHHPVFWRNLLYYMGQERFSSHVVDKIYDEYLRFYINNITLHDDAVYLLEKAKDNIKLALLANGNEKRVNLLIDEFKLYKYFDRIVISGETPFKKPERLLFDMLLKELDVTSSEAVMVGDRYDTDIVGANGAGIPSVHIFRKAAKQYPSKGLSAMPNVQLRDLYQVTDLIMAGKLQFGIKQNLSIPEKTIKNAIILCGGEGKRMGNVDNIAQKCLLPVDKVSILERNIHLFMAAGCKRIILITKHNAHIIDELIEKLQLSNVEIITHRTLAEGTAAALSDALFDYKINEPFYYCHGNIHFQPDIITMLCNSCSDHYRTVTLAVVDGYRSIQHARLKSLNNKGVGIILPPDNTGDEKQSKLFMGLAIYNDHVRRCLDQTNANSMTEEVIPYLAEKEVDIQVVQYDKPWIHLERPEDYQAIKNRTIVELLY